MATGVKGMSSRAAQAERTRQQILQTARRLFSEYGYDAASLQMIADELGLTKAAVYYYFRAKADIRHEIVRSEIERLKTLLDEAAALRGRRARVEYLVDGFVGFFVESRRYGLMSSSDHAAKREKLDEEPTGIRQQALALIFGDSPTATERLAFSAVSLVPAYLPELADLSDDELRQALRTIMLHILRVPAGRPALRCRPRR
ncbi:MAG TPA: TetR family transcriptional regulator [Trebonia sp.]